jgi:4-amino-4-deoxy-L-arabinose transferase-like glycosyltransferase
VKYDRVRLTLIVLAVIIATAIGVRAWGIGFGLPHLYHPDENVYVDIAQRMFKTGDWNPHFFNYPSLFLYLNALAYYPYAVFRWMGGVFGAASDIPAPQMLVMGVGQTADSGTFLLGRFLTLAFGVGAVVLTYVVGKRLLGSVVVGLLAALLLAVSSTAVMSSRSITPDTFLLFFLMLAFLGAVLVYKEGEWKHYVMAGVGAGLATSTKYNALLIVLTLVAAHFLRSGWAGWRDKRLYGSLVLAGTVFFAASPFALLDFSTFLRDLSAEGEHYLSGHTGMDGNTLAWYWEYLRSTEGIIVLLGAFEVVRGIIVRSKPILLLWVFPVAYFIFITGFTVRNDRTILPMLPFAFLLGASFLYESWAWAARREGVVKLAGQLLIGILGLIAVAFPLVQMIANSNIRENGVRSREEASAWVDGNIKAGAHIALEPYSPYVDPGKYRVQAFGSLIDNTPDWYRAQGFDYLIFSAGRYDRYFQEVERYPGEVARYNALFALFKMVKSFPDERYEIRVYELDEAP